MQQVIQNTSHHYSVPTYAISSEEGLQHEGFLEILFCKGEKGNHIQTGVLTEDLLKIVHAYLTAVNVGDLSSIETSMAITKIDEALLWIEKRRLDRAERGVLTTYKK